MTDQPPAPNDGPAPPQPPRPPAGVPPGWYAAPDRVGMVRYWSGEVWTDDYASVPGGPPAREATFARRARTVAVVAMVAVLALVFGATVVTLGGDDSAPSPDRTSVPPRVESGTATAEWPERLDGEQQRVINVLLRAVDDSLTKADLDEIDLGRRPASGDSGRLIETTPVYIRLGQLIVTAEAGDGLALIEEGVEKDTVSKEIRVELGKPALVNWLVKATGEDEGEGVVEITARHVERADPTQQAEAAELGVDDVDNMFLSLRLTIQRNPATTTTSSATIATTVPDGDGDAGDSEGLDVGKILSLAAAALGIVAGLLAILDRRRRVHWAAVGAWRLPDRGPNDPPRDESNVIHVVVRFKNEGKRDAEQVQLDESTVPLSSLRGGVDTSAGQEFKVELTVHGRIPDNVLPVVLAWHDKRGALRRRLRLAPNSRRQPFNLAVGDHDPRRNND